MNSNPKEHVELAIWKELASENLSVSHDRWHIDRVLSFACQLQALYGGDLEVITAAVIMHDLGRVDSRLHGQNSIDESIARARRILLRINFPKVEQVIQAIEEHDKPEVRPSTIEGRILKDADFLGGFGAWGVLRIALWAGETGAGVDQVLDRLQKRMPKRLANLEFPESQRLAMEETLFAHLFSALLDRPATLSTHGLRGQYIVLEGISGSGKDTQANALQERLRARGCTVVRVHEPDDMYRDLRDVWQEKHHNRLEDPLLMKFLLMADRYELIRDKVCPGLTDGHIVLSVRNFVSTLVYQCADDLDVAATAFAHRFAPLPDVLLLYDVEPGVAYSRIEGREKKGLYETRELLEVHRKRYRDVCQQLFAPRLKIIDASQPIEVVEEQTWQALEGLCTAETRISPG